MRNLNSDIRLTDELERQLMKQAMDDQFRFKPGVSLKHLWTKMTQRHASSKARHHSLKTS